MTSRNDLDRPASAISATFGVVFIVVGILLFVFLQGPALGKYTVAWGEADAGKSAAVPFAGNGQSAQTSPLTVSGDLSNVTVILDACNDTPSPVGGQAATITWHLFKDGKAYDNGTSPCNDNGTPVELKAIHLHDHPDVGQVKGKDLADARSNVWDGHTNKTHTFYLAFQYDRPADTVPGGLPVGASTFAGRMSLAVTTWSASVNAKDAEVGK